MSLSEPEEIERLAIGELRSLVESLLAEVARLRAENAALREEIARLKGLPPRPKLKPSGMEKASQPHRHLQAAGGAAADQSARRFRDRGSGGLARGRVWRARPGSPSTTPAPSTPGATASPPRSATAGLRPSAPACRSPAPTSSTACAPVTMTLWSTRRQWPTCAGTIWPAR